MLSGPGKYEPNNIWLTGRPNGMPETCCNGKPLDYHRRGQGNRKCHHVDRIVQHHLLEDDQPHPWHGHHGHGPRYPQAGEIDELAWGQEAEPFPRPSTTWPSDDGMTMDSLFDLYQGGRQPHHGPRFGGWQPHHDPQFGGRQPHHGPRFGGWQPPHDPQFGRQQPHHDDFGFDFLPPAVHPVHLPPMNRPPLIPLHLVPALRVHAGNRFHPGDQGGWEVPWEQRPRSPGSEDTW